MLRTSVAIALALAAAVLAAYGVAGALFIGYEGFAGVLIGGVLALTAWRLRR